MAFKLNHVHLKTQDPKQTAQFYVDNLGATIVSEISDRGYRLDLHGLTINLTTHIADQKRDQRYGMEHIAVNTDDMDGAVSNLKANGAKVLEEMVHARRPLRRREQPWQRPFARQSHRSRHRS
jgi:catechol 2,3-dioxygenase-like lactoylglutathione lyase family enzyme